MTSSCSASNHYRSILAGALSIVLAASSLTSRASEHVVGSGQPIHNNWHEIKWPFPVDQWGSGRAFECRAADCGTDITLYLRPKLGFCNCTSGVSDDAELDRVGDLELISEKFAGLSEGRPITVSSMSGRSRAYQVEPRYGAILTAVAIAFNDKCDVMVATVIADRRFIAEVERAALDFLNSRPVLALAEAEFGK
jgi:hypothetical protein